MILNRAVAKYLHRYAESDLKLSLPHPHGAAVIIPAYDEGECLDRAIASVPHADMPILILAVVNEAEGSPAAARQHNAATLQRLRAAHPQITVPQSNRVTLHAVDQGSLALIHAALPAGEGVGLARKIGADAALRLWAEGQVHSPWLHGTDADAELPADYFSAVADHGFPQPSVAPAAKIAPTAPAAKSATEQAAALLHPFRHRTDRNRSAILEYEAWLRYYVAGLRWAGSPYAMHTIGSTISVHAEAYAKVRGYPRRTAGEDFYLLNKLAKVGRVLSVVDGQPIRLQARLSDRVPFGTGRAVAEANRGLQRLFYHPRCFAYLRTFLTALDLAVTSEASHPSGLELNATLLRGKANLHMEDHGEALAEAAEAIQAGRAVQRARTLSTHIHTRRKHIHDWFDAARTRKLVHWIRDHRAPSLPMAAALQQAPFMDETSDDPDVRAILACAEIMP